MIAMAQGNPKVALKHGLADFYGKQEDVNPNRRNQSFFVDLLVRLVNSIYRAKINLLVVMPHVLAGSLAVCLSV